MSSSFRRWNGSGTLGKRTTSSILCTLPEPGKTTSPDTSTTLPSGCSYWMPVGNSGSSFLVRLEVRVGRAGDAERFRAAPTPRWDGRDAEVFALPNCELSDERLSEASTASFARMLARRCFSYADSSSLALTLDAALEVDAVLAVDAALASPVAWRDLPLLVGIVCVCVSQQPLPMESAQKCPETR